MSGNLQPFIYVVVGLLVIGLLFRMIKGVIRLVLTLGVLAVVAFLVLRALS